MQLILTIALVIGQTPATDPEFKKPLPDLGTRKSGVDWTRFLGPSGDSKSPETGITTAWPPEGPPKIWECPIAEGYAMPVIAKGRLLHFDRVGESSATSLPS